MGRGSGLGKLILCGEHAVVYGYPALAVAVDRGVAVEVFERPGPTCVTEPSGIDPRLNDAVRAVLPDHGWGVRLSSELPTGRGMGSSAAIAVGLVRAWAQLQGEALGVDAVWERAFAVENVFHGNPSGLDHAVSARGGALLYRRGPPPEFTPVPCKRLPLVVLDSGDVGNTAELVAGVAARRPGIDGVLDEIGALVERAVEVLDDADQLGPLLTRNHALLRQIGVSTDRLDAIVDLALGAGALGAKLSGAGGGGVVLALAPDPDPILEAAAEAGVEAFAA